MVGPNRAYQKAHGVWSKLSPGLLGIRLMYWGLSIEPGPTGSGLGPALPDPALSPKILLIKMLKITFEPILRLLEN